MRWIKSHARQLSPLWTYEAVKCYSINFHKVHKTRLIKGLRVVRKGYSSCYFAADEFKKSGLLFKKNLRNKAFIEHTIRRAYKVKKEFEDYSKKIKKTDVKKLENKELAKLFSGFYKRFSRCGVYAGFMNSIDNVLIDELKKTLKKEYIAYIPLLTKPEFESVEKKEQKNLMRIALEILKNRNLTKLFKKDTEKIKEEIKKYPKINKKILQHHRRYCWIPVWLDINPVWKLEHFLENLKSLIKEGEKRIRGELTKKELPKKKEIMKKLDGESKYIVRVIQEYSKIKMMLPTLWSYTTYNALNMYEEISRRLGITIKQLTCLTTEEIVELLRKNKKADVNLIKEREILTVVISKSKGKINVYSGSKAEEIIKKEISKEKLEELGFVEGTTACSGIVRGKAKIILTTRDLWKMKDGDILVTSQTTPFFTVAIKKAEAIVTDEGGMTCHAAVVSREMKIPCVVGTKFATRIFKDNDKIEVDANTGIVKKLK